METIIACLRVLKQKDPTVLSSAYFERGAASEEAAQEASSSVSAPAAASFPDIVDYTPLGYLTDWSNTNINKILSDDEIWAKIGCGKKPFKPEYAEDPRNCTRQVYRCIPGDVEAFDKEGLPCAHYRAKTPARKYLASFPRRYGPGFRMAAQEVGEAILRDWFAQRPAVAARLFPPVDDILVWEDPDEKRRGLTDMHDIGRWYYYKLKKEVPAFPVGTHFHLSRPVLGHESFTQLVHCSSMYTLANTVMNGLSPSTIPGKGNKIGLYCFKTQSREVYASKSSHYCCYESLCACGHDIFFGPRFMLEGQMWRVHEEGKMSMGNGQQCVPAGAYHLVGFYVHVMTRDELDIVHELSDAKKLWFKCGHWDPRYEVDPMSVDI